MYYDGRLIDVLALFFLNSWSNSMAEPEGLFYNTIVIFGNTSWCIISDLFIRSYYEWNGKRYEVFGTNGIVDGRQSINNPIDPLYGFSGKIAPWSVGNINMEGGAGQLNTGFSRELLEKSCIINDVGDIIIK